MNNYPELEEHINNFKQDEKYIEYFKNFAIENIKYNPKYVKEIMNRLLQISEQNNYEYSKNWCFVYNGWYESMNCNFKKAIDFNLKANLFFENIGSIRGRIITCALLILDYAKLGKFDLAIMNGLKGIKLANQIEDSNLLVELLINIVHAYIESNNYDEALKIIDKLEIYENNLKLNDKIEFYIILAEFKLKFKDFEKAKEYCDMSLDLINKNNDEIYKVKILSIKSEVIYRLGKHEKAVEEFNNVINICKKNNREYLKIKTLIRWAKCDLNFGKYVFAENKFIEALEYLKNSDFIILESKAYSGLSNIYKKLGKYEQACEAIEKFNHCEKIIYNSFNSVWFTILKYENVVEEAKLYKNLYKKMDVISELGKKITSTLEIDEMFKVIYAEVGDLVDADIFGIALYEERFKELNYKLFINNKNTVNLKPINVNDKKNLAGYCFRNKKDILINDFFSEYSKYTSIKSLDDIKSKSMIYVPIIVKGKTVGIITMQNYKKNAYNKNHVSELKVLASYMGVALENSRLFNKVKYFATYDSLTGVFNRSVILKEGKEILKSSITNKNKFSIIMIDIDYFKKINDTYGHNTGDIVLKEVTSIIKHEIRKDAIIGRYGGEEFLVLLPNVELETARIISERIRKAVENHSCCIDNTIFNNITLSLGIYEFKKDECNFYEGLKKADKVLYMAKTLGRNRSVAYMEREEAQ
ncbi:sensor domain-containing diguanylate cyclase [Clostridium weizhouense]|uniref:Diguanylate cyclase n=1 Tax=Clostridium weizhouense TaxID=2859781 RepID=A0ABS7ANW2_9CLOT|nr:sensor domain-containing diguanylate cyclase [Clostridium weizhouense]MBW6410324.1 diguanylate cyclase [Clostridium weizhouense]